MDTAWEAVYNDKYPLRQFNADGAENSFKDINQDELFEFRIFHKGKIISVFMPTGTFGINGLIYNTDISLIKDAKYRLIHFVRRRKVMGNGENEDFYFIGFQVNIDGKNHKRMIQICNNKIQFVNE
jgi:hypothetical protein